VNNVKPKNPLLWVKYRILEWQWDRVLRKSGYKDWGSYFIVNDLDYNPAGRTVKDQLHGYPYIALVPYLALETRFEPMHGPVEHCGHIIEWCNKNCRRKFRCHWERVVQDHNGQYLPNGISGYDELFFGFKDYEDYITFKMQWS
jgi:hypothetical protein